MKYITVKLTEDQAHFLIHELWLEIDNKHAISAKHNAFVIRIANKIAKQLGLTKNS